MNKEQVLYLVFGAVLVAALIFDLGFLSKKDKRVTFKAALLQTLFWVLLSLAFCGFIFIQNKGGTGKADAISYITAYLLEWSLSLDNIFVFIIIFSFFGVREKNYARALLAGILMAILFRIIFIAIGSSLVARFDWILYLFGVFLVYTGIKMWADDDNPEFDPGRNRAYRILKRMIRITDEECGNRFIIKKNGIRFFTRLALAVLMLGLIDLVFAVDSIPAVFAVIPDPSKKLLIYSSNIFAVLGLRSMFFLLRGAAERFSYLEQGIAAVLLFIGIKMLLPALAYLGVDPRYLNMPDWLSLALIVACLAGSIIYSVYRQKKMPYPNPDENEPPEPLS